ncbi:MAG: beta-ketoacyl synthase chain length factor [Pseudomonadota bacterium]
MSITVYLDAIGAIGPGANNWPEWRALLQHDESWQPAKTKLPVLNVLPSAERRRTGAGVKIALATGLEALAMAGVEPSTVATVFSSSGGDGDNCHLICEELASADRLISPTRFHNSVHNAPSGYWGIASGAMLASTSIGAFDASFAAGLLEAGTQCFVDRKPVLLVAYDTPYPEPLNGTRPMSDSFAVALLISPAPNAHTIAQVTMGLSDSAPAVMQFEALEQVRTTIPAARCLPLLRELALHAAAGKLEVSSEVHVEYLHGRSLGLKLSPVA